MQTLLKQSIIGGLSFLLLTGIAFSVGSSEPSVFEGEALTHELGINSGYTGGADGSTAWTTSNVQTGSFGSKTLLQTLNTGTIYVGSIVSTAKVYPSGSTYGYTSKLKIGTGTALGWDLTFTLANSYKATSASLVVKQFTSAGTSYDTDTTISVNSSIAQAVTSTTSQTLTFSFSSSNQISIKPGAGKRFFLESISLLIDTSPGTTDAETFSTSFLSSTDNKENCTSSEGWLTLKNSFDALSALAKEEFKTNISNSTIVNARARYNYLVSFNNTLTTFY
jgi:hypothetical protein